MHPTRLERVTFGSVDQCSIQLSYGCRYLRTPKLEYYIVIAVFLQEKFNF
jgi:hypothetical protein